MLQKESSGSSEEESAHMAHMGRYRQDESDEDFNSNQVSPDSTTLSVSLVSFLIRFSVGFIFGLYVFR